MKRLKPFFLFAVLLTLFCTAKGQEPSPLQLPDYPKYKEADTVGFINTDIQYKKLIGEASFHISDSAQKYNDAQKRITQNYRNVYSHLAMKLIDENKKDSALAVLNYCMAEFPSGKVEHNYYSIGFIEAYYRLNHIDEANILVEELLQTTVRDSEKWSENPTNDNYEIRQLIETLRRLAELTTQYVKDSSLNRNVKEAYIHYYKEENE